MSTLTVRPAATTDLERVESLLSTADLPHEDVRDKPECFFLARDDGSLVGCGGVEVQGTDGLLRSVVVAEGHRGEGYGRALVDALEARARADGVETLHLLTTTAAGFFERCGYGVVPRESAPPGIRETTEFAELCPESATCMRKRLR